MAGNGQTIFIIDDDESVRRALRRLLQTAGRNVKTFAMAESFLQTAEQTAPACLVLDVHLPGLSGLELQQQMIAEGRGIPIVFITAYEDEPTREKALRAGAIAFLKKPFEEQALLDAVDRAVG